MDPCTRGVPNLAPPHSGGCPKEETAQRERHTPVPKRQREQEPNLTLIEFPGRRITALGSGSVWEVGQKWPHPDTTPCRWKFLAKFLQTNNKKSNFPMAIVLFYPRNKNLIMIRAGYCLGFFIYLDVAVLPVEFFCPRVYCSRHCSRTVCLRDFLEEPVGFILYLCLPLLWTVSK